MVQEEPAPSELPQLLFSMKSPALAPVIETPEMLNAEAPEFESVTSCATLETVTGSFANARLEGERLTVPLEPEIVPVRLTLCGLPPAASANWSEAVRVPVAVGLKVTEILQDELTPRDLPQLFDWEKSFGSAPASAILEIVIDDLPEFSRRTDWELLAVPTPVLEKLRLEGEMEATAWVRTTSLLAPATVPVRARLCDPPAALSRNWSVAEPVPAEEGLKVTATLHFAFGAIATLQLFVSAKSEASVPET
jgi:hypothetical protein